MQRTRLALTGILVLAAGAPVLAHYPMLEAEAPIVEPGETVTVEFSVGHPYTNDRFPVRRPARVRAFSPSSGRPAYLTAAITTAGTPEVRAWRVDYTPDVPGDHVLSFTGLPYSEPPRRQIDDYAKLVLHARGAQIGWNRVVGDPLEIVPLTRPYGLPVGATFRGKVLLHDQPFADGVLEAETYTDVTPDPLPELMEYRRAERTDPNGCFAVTLDRAGWWLLSVATDGGPGEQGLSNRRVQRAVFWLWVGPYDASMRRALPPIPAEPRAVDPERQGLALPAPGPDAGWRAWLGWATLHLALALGLGWGIARLPRGRGEVPWNA
ncbi:MAG: DUF4198 domain-containing protein [Planctomycetota bacterium]